MVKWEEEGKYRRRNLGIRYIKQGFDRNWTEIGQKLDKNWEAKSDQHILFDHQELLIRPSVSLYMYVSSFKYNIISLEAFFPNILAWPD